MNTDKPQSKRIILFDSDKPQQSVPGNLAECVKFLAEILESVPEEHRDSVLIEHKTEERYDYYNTRTLIYYYRMETEEECQARVEEVNKQRMDFYLHAKAQAEQLRKELGL